MMIPTNMNQTRRPASRLTLLVRFFPGYLLALGVYALCATMFNFEPESSGLVFGTTFHLLSGAQFGIRYNELFIIVMLGMLLVEIIKASNVSHESTWLEHMFSTVVFIAFIVTFLTWDKAGNATFLTLTCMAGIDVLAGWTISYRAALRDVALG